MEVLIISCSKKAYELGEEVRKIWVSSEPDVSVLHKTKTKMLPELSMEERIEDCVAERFEKVDVILFICASGIAVRSIAPLIKHKSIDPAILVMDETGKYCISLLSGHAGGANLFAQQVAGMVGAEPVITTATDREGKFAVDVFARKNGLKIVDWKKAKDVSVSVLSEDPVTICSDYQIEGDAPKEIKLLSENDADAAKVPDHSGKELCSAIWVTNKLAKSEKEKKALRLIVPNITLGIGCRKDTEFELIETAVQDFLEKQGIDIHAVKQVASIDIKAEEPGLLEFTKKHKIPFEVFSAETLSALEGDFSESEFVASVTGVSNVCERAAVAGGENLLVKKTRYPQVTIAMSESPVKLCF